MFFLFFFEIFFIFSAKRESFLAFVDACVMPSTRNPHSTRKVRVVLRREDNLVGPHDFNGVFEG